jgi:hypothetical protein
METETTTVKQEEKERVKCSKCGLIHDREDRLQSSFGALGVTQCPRCCALGFKRAKKGAKNGLSPGYKRIEWARLYQRENLGWTPDQEDQMDVNDALKRIVHLCMEAMTDPFDDKDQMMLAVGVIAAYIMDVEQRRLRRKSELEKDQSMDEICSKCGQVFGEHNKNANACPTPDNRGYESDSKFEKSGTIKTNGEKE